MNLSLERVVDSTISLLEFAATWWLQASVLLGAAFVASVCLRSRGPAFHSVIFRVTLCAVLLCPLITKVLTISGASLFSLDLRSMMIADEELVVSVPIASNAVRTYEHTSSNVTVASKLAPFGSNYPPESDSAVESKLDPFAEQESEPKTQAATIASVASTTDVAPKSSFPWIFVLGTLLTVWIIGTVTLLLRILRDLYHGKQILSSSVSGDESAISICGQIASKLKLKTPDVQINPFLNSPCLLGHWRPTVLLPEETEPATYPQVFLHELAHLRRGDWLWNLTGRLAIALLWSQPLIWWLQRRSLTVAEEICDDYVIEYGCSREGYLRQLVEIAERSLPLASATGVSMVGFRTKLGNRATRILDTTRALSTSAGRRFACFIMLAMLAVTMGVAQIEVGRPAVALAQETESRSGPAIAPSSSTEIIEKTVEAIASGKNTFTGFVQDEQGKAIPGAFVSLIATKRDGDNYLYAESLGETKSGIDGKYSLTLKDVSSKTHTNAHILVRTETSGIAAFAVNFDGQPQDVGTAKLQPQKIVKVKLIDLEGRPAPNVRLNIGAIMTASLGVGFEQIKGDPAAWFPELKSDSQGMLELHNLVAGQGVYLNVPASDDFAPQHIALNTGMPAERPERDRTYRPMIVNAAPGDVATVPLAPAKIFEGTVVLGENGPPAANAKISISASQQELGSMINTFSMTDANGHFRLNPQPGIIFGINAHPPEDAPFQIARLEGLRWTAGEQSKQLKITLQKGVFATGKVVDAQTKQPIPNASVLYEPAGTNPNSTESVVTGWQGIKKTNEKGEFSIAVLPGEGWLYIQSDDRSYILQTKQSRELESGNKGGRYLYAHDFAKINAPATDQLAPLTIELHKGKTSKIIASAPGGSLIKEGLAISRLKISPYMSGMWRAHSPDEIRNGTVIFEGLSSGVTYPIYLLDPIQRLGATVNISADQPELKVTLEPTGSLKARFLDADGKPLAGQDLNPMFVATPGLGMFEMSDANRDAVLADEDFEVNYDRDSNPRRHSGNDGVSIVSTLIPGATYRYYIGRERREFVAKSGETYDLGDIKVNADGTQSVANMAAQEPTAKDKQTDSKSK